MRITLVLIASLSLSGCAAGLSYLATGGAVLGSDQLAKDGVSKAERQAASAEAIGNDLNYRKIKIKDLEKSDEVDSWTARTSIGDYRCTQLKGRSSATCEKL